MSSFCAAFAEGDRITFIGLVGRADLNSQAGIVKSWEEDRQRFLVCVASSDENVFVKASNLEHVAPSSTDTDPIYNIAKTMQEIHTMDHSQQPIIQQYMIFGGKCMTPVELGYFPMRMLATRIGADTFPDNNLTSLASASFPASWHGFLTSGVEIERNTMTRFATHFDKRNQPDRMTILQSLHDTLKGFTALLFGLGVEREGRGLIVVEAQGTVQQICNGFLGKSKFLPIVASFLTHKQSIPWYESNIKVSGCSKSDANRHALEQVGNNEKSEQQKVTSLTTVPHS